jgi:hypothetical protein
MLTTVHETYRDLALLTIDLRMNSPDGQPSQLARIKIVVRAVVLVEVTREVERGAMTRGRAAREGMGNETRLPKG